MANRLASLTVWAVLVFVPTNLQAQSNDGPLSALGGSWSGNGSIAFSDGHKERIRCRSDYSPDAAGSNLKINLACASDSYRFDLAADVQYQAGTISGRWSEHSRGAAGSLSGKAIGNNILIDVAGQTFAAMMNIATRGDNQTIRIESPGASVSEVTITMARK